ncbi:ABC transporter permease [Terrabacter terrigena]|uniref:ABC transporter permease n=1 Tax=Terrabacter terrigena TaxID=574718 RepID=A0ABW3MUV2_9MICO
MADLRDEPSGAEKHGVVTTQPTAEATPPPVVPERGAPPPPTGVLGLLVREQSIIVPLVAVVAALLIGGILIRAQGVNPTYAYQTLFTYSFLTADGLQGTFEKMVPLILCGLAVVIPLRVGLFNIGAQGQLMAGAIAAAATAHAVREAPGVIVAVIAMVAGILAGAMWASIAGALKASRGVHEVISTIMLNSIAAGLIDYLVNGPLKDPSSAYPASYPAPDASRFVPLGVVPIGLPIALVLAVLVAWMLRRTTLGFQFETIGRNRHAASYAGIKLSGMIVLAMAIAGGLAGLAGSVEYLEIDPYRYQDGIAGSLGFDGITIALLARSNPLGTIPAALLVGALRAGSSNLMFNTGIQPEIVDMLLAITLLLVSLPIIAKLLFRRHTAKSSALASSWGS